MAKLTPTDARVVHHTAAIRGQTYHYIVAQPPSGQPVKGTIVLIHGFPDLGFGWRNQVPLLAEQLGLQVVVPDMLGYGGTDAPDEPARYSYKNVCADLVEIVDAVGVLPAVAEDRKFFVGGHDWGGAVAWRMALWFPGRVRAVFSICTPFFPPSKMPFVPMDMMVKVLPNFGYQRQFASDALYTFAGAGARDHIRQLLTAMYGGRAADVKDAADPADAPEKAGGLFDNSRGVYLDRLSSDMVPSPLLSADEMDYYVEQYARHGLRGPTNWYRTYQTNWEEERVFVTGDRQADVHIAAPALMVNATNDVALPAALSDAMPQHFTTLTRGSVTAGHWALWQATDAVNEQITGFLAPLIEAAPKASL